ncbi:GtrA family protein [Weissella muntiaci]|uniref:GtrA family protein n=1 Tax=Weissella muntiaci TaxID=2508881 RepID=A0A6C2C8L1_9LACO|nr:GtrA family protein [Weissella muntiaci]TYC50304.1 GtrA family protein [Weissella muntiaci]
MYKLKMLIGKYQEQLMYLIFGGLTTVINIIIYWVVSRLMGGTPQISYWVAWLLSVLFAYWTNRIWVFTSKSTGAVKIIREILRFFTARIVTGIIGALILSFGVHALHQNDFIWNIIQNIFVIISNYVLSKWLVFRGWKGEQ